VTKAVPNRQIAEEAAEWAVRIDAGPLDAADRRALAAWLKASPAHVDELLYSATILGGLRAVDRERRLSIDDYLASSAPEVIPLFTASPAGSDDAAGPSATTESATPSSRKSGLRRRWAIAASVALMAVGAVTLAAWGPWSAAHRDAGAAASSLYATDLGEQRSLTLADGSVVFLNTNSKLRVGFTSDERRLDLLQGEALFEVAHEPQRPFRVFAAGTMAQAIGTKFNVRHTRGGVRVVVVEGEVLVDPRASDARPLAARRVPSAKAGELTPDQALLVAGQQADLSLAQAAPRIADADIVAAASWRMRQLSFDDAALGEIVAEFNRYNRTPIVLSDPALSETRFSGVFDANDPKSFVAFLELSSLVEVDRSRHDRIVLAPRGR